MIVRRYLAREIYLTIVFVLVAFIALFSFFDLINELDEVGQNGYKIQHAALYVLLNAPTHLYQLLPIAALIGTIYLLAQLAAQSEFVIFRAAGMSTRQLLFVLLQIALPLVVLTFVVGEWIAPWAARSAEQYRLQVRQQGIQNDFRSGLWIKDLKNTAGAVSISYINIWQVRPDQSLEGVRIYEFDQRYRLTAILDAERGEYLPPSKWRFRKLQETRFTETEAAQGLPQMAQQVSVRHYDEKIWESRLHPDILSVLLVVPEKMSALSLASYIRHLQVNKQKTQRYEIAFWKKFTYPLALFVLMALALPFAYMHFRTGGVSLKVFAGIMIGVAFYLLNNLFSHLGMINTWQPFLTAFFPGTLMLAITLIVLRWVERR